MTIKYISFDVWNTLITPNKEYAEKRNAIIAKHFDIPVEQAKHIYKTCKGYLDKKAEEDGVCQTTRVNWQMLEDAVGKQGNKEIDYLIAECDRAFEWFPPVFDPQLVEELWWLEMQGYSLSIKSNTNFTSGNVLRKVLFDKTTLFDVQHYSDEWGVAKPSKTFFMATEHAYGAYDPKEYLHVGDNVICDGGSEQLGWSFIHVKNPQDLLEKLKRGEIK